MDASTIYIIMIISVALSALCSTLEATLLSTPLSFITGLEEQGVKGASTLKKLKQSPDRAISAILCLNTIANTVGASIVGLSFTFIAIITKSFFFTVFDIFDFNKIFSDEFSRNKLRSAIVEDMHKNIHFFVVIVTNIVGSKEKTTENMVDEG